MFPFGKKIVKKHKKEKCLTYDEAISQNKQEFEELMTTLGFKKNGDKDNPDWEKHVPFLECHSIEKEGEKK